jgi:2-methylisocitrate lyase-like PEP mutase family enzyme
VDTHPPERIKGAAVDCSAVTDLRRRLRQALAGPDLVVAPFVYDGLQARLAEAAGFEAVYMTGFGTSAAHGLPDLGLLSLDDMVDNVRVVAGSVSIPAICDADTGYGGPLNVMRTVRAYEDAGAAALHIEDQVSPKRCGLMQAKVRAALDGRRDPDLVVIARTDALETEGWDGAEARARSYREAGADLVFVDGVKDARDLDEYARRLADVPCLYSGQLETPAEVAARGFRVMIHIGTLTVAFRAMREALAELRATGRVASAADWSDFDAMLEVLGAAEASARAAKYES